MTIETLTDKQRLLNLYQEKLNDIRSFIAFRVGDAMAAEDLVQDLYIKLARIEKSVKIDNSLGYLFRMALNLSIDWIRFQKRRSFMLESFAQVLAPAHSGDPQDAVTAQMDMDRLGKIVSRLSLQRRRIFYLSRVEGMTQKEIADQFQISAGTVQNNIKKTLEYSLKRLKE